MVELTIDEVIPNDEDYSKYMDIAADLDAKTYNHIGETYVLPTLLGTHFTETDYRAGIGFLKSKGYPK
jgi:hypothetical protein